MQACAKGGGGGGAHAPQILADQKVPPAAAARRITTWPPRFLDFGTCLMWLKDQLYIELGTKWLQENNIHNKKNSKLLAYEAACSCFQPKNAWKFDQQNDFTVFFHFKSYYDLRLQFLLVFLWS